MQSKYCRQMNGETPWILAAGNFAAVARDFEDCCHVFGAMLAGILQRRRARIMIGAVGLSTSVQ